MGIETIAIASLVVGVAGGVMQYQQQRKANAAAEDAADAQKAAREEQNALNAQKAASERRQQIREERVRRAQVLQAAQNTGTTGSSGELGAVGALSTNLNSNIGANVGTLMHGENISAFNQSAADSQTQAIQAQTTGQMWGQVSSFGKSIFAAAGGFKTLKNSSGNSVFDVSGNLYTGVTWK